MATSNKTRRRARLLPFPRRGVIPNMITLIALCIGLTSIHQSLLGKFEFAIACIIAAAMIDMIDGRLARLLNATSEMGAQLDSLADFVNFGIAPAFIVYFWAGDNMARIIWVAVLLYTVCCALRLARFNTTHETDETPAWQRKFFIGVPSPSAAGLVMLPIFFAYADIIDLSIASPLLLAAWMISVGLLMVSNIPTFSGRSLTGNLRRDFILPFMLTIGFTVTLLSTFPWVALIGLGACYLTSLPFSWWQWRQHAKAMNSAL